MTWIACRWSRWSRTRSGSCCGLRCKGRVARCSRVWEWPCPRRCSRPRPPPRGRMLRMVPRRLIDALSLYYSGRCNILLSKMSLTQGVIKTFDHDFPSFASGVIIPHGFYDVKRNAGHVNLGTSRDTGEFACDSIERWWEQTGRALYPRARSILLLCDGGGSNSASQYLFKEDLQRLVDRLGIEIRVAHYPPYCSKYNPIEHRVFPHVTRACQGVVFESVELVKQLMEKTRTSTGLRVTVDILDKVYETGRKYAEGFKQNKRIVFDDILPKWNYRAVPSGS